MKDEVIRKAFLEGVKQGMYIHAWWKNGVLYIGQQRPDGTGVYKLKEEQKKVDEGYFDSMLNFPENSYSNERKD